MRVAVPPDAGNVQMPPCKSMASVRPSGDAVTAMEVPSVTVTFTVRGGMLRGDDGAGAPDKPAACARLTTAATNTADQLLRRGITTTPRWVDGPADAAARVRDEMRRIVYAPFREPPALASPCFR